MSEDQAPGEPPQGDQGEAGEQPPASPAAPESGQWDLKAAGIPAPDSEADPRNTEPPSVTDAKEESLDYDYRSFRRLRFDFARVETVRDIAGRDVNNHYYGGRREKQAQGRISVAELARAARVHVTARSDAELRQGLAEDRVVFLCGRMGSGRRTSATVVLDRLTGTARAASRVTILDAASGLAGLPERLEAGSGHLLDASGETWIDAITEAQVAGARGALGGAGFLVILVDADSVRSLPGRTVDHAIPDLVEVAVFHLAARLASDGAPDTAEARALIAEACRIDSGTAQWHEELTKTVTSGPAEAALLAEAIESWHERRKADRKAKPSVEEFRVRRRYQLAADLLRQGGRTDSPLRQSYVISAAVLDRLAVSEVVEGAGRLSTLLEEVEHPGAPGHREIFGQPLARWLRHVDMTTMAADRRNRDGAVARMPSRELSRSVIEVAWREYDAAREPVLAWLMSLCQDHPDEKVRIRAVQALAVIAQHDYALVKDRVLEVWSRSERRMEHQAAAWLLEAMVLEAAHTKRAKDLDRVKDLLWRWSRSGDPGKRAVAVRAYGTAVARSLPRDPDRPPDAILGVRFSAPDPWLGALPELALCEMYMLGLSREATAELALWMRGFPVMRERSGRALVRISRVRRVSDDQAPGDYDLLRRLAGAPGELGLDIAQVAALWQVACRHESSRSAAWQMLGLWAQSCRDYPELTGTFTELADEFEKATDDDEFRARLGVYRRRWSTYLNEEDQK
jgi:hypothetical protein